MFHKNKEKGTNLIEVVVTISIFSIFMIGIMIVFVSFMEQQRKILIRQELLSQTTYAVERMNRALRFAKDGYENGGNSVSFVNHMQDDELQSFSLSGGQIIHERPVGSSPLTSDKFEVDNLQFNITDGDDVQPRVRISFTIKSEIGGDEQDIGVQTTVSQRNLNIDPDDE